MAEVYFNGKHAGTATHVDFGDPVSERPFAETLAANGSFTAIINVPTETCRALRLFWAAVDRRHFLRTQAKRKGRPGWKSMRPRP